MFIEPHNLRVAIPLVLAATSLAGCTTLTLDGAGGPQGQRTYFGIVRVETPVTPEAPLLPPRVRVLDVSTWGLRIDRGMSVGYLKDLLISVPMDCRLVVFIRSSQELAHAEALLRNLSEEEPCVARTP